MRNFETDLKKTVMPKKPRFYLLSLAPAHAPVDDDPQSAIVCYYGGRSRFLSSVSDVGKDTLCKVVGGTLYCGSGLWRRWSKRYMVL